MSPDLQVFDGASARAAWDDLIAPGGHVLQAWAWGELKSRFGWRAERVALGPACAQILYRSLPGGVGTIAYVPKGPLLEFQNDALVRSFLSAIQPLARQKGAICLKIEPDQEDDPALADRLRSLGFRLSPQQVQPRRTSLVGLDADPEEVLGRMKQKTRYNIRLAGRKGVTVRAGEEADLPAFYQLMEITAQRDGFGIHSQAYYETAHRLFVPLGQGCLSLAEY